MHAEARRLAAKTGRTLSAFIEDALRGLLARRRQPHTKERVVLPAHGGGELQPGIDLDDSASLWEQLDS